MSHWLNYNRNREKQQQTTANIKRGCGERKR